MNKITGKLAEIHTFVGLVSGRQTEEIATVPHEKMARTARTPSEPGVPGGSPEEKRDSGRRKLGSQ